MRQGGREDEVKGKKVISKMETKESGMKANRERKEERKDGYIEDEKKAVRMGLWE